MLDHVRFPNEVKPHEIPDHIGLLKEVKEVKPHQIPKDIRYIRILKQVTRRIPERN